MSNFFNPYEGSSGGGGGPVQISAKEGNILTNESDGLYAPTESISSEPGNAITKKDDGLYVKQKVSSKINFSLTPSAWSSDKTFTIISEDIKSSSIISLGVQNNITEDQYDKLAEAKIVVKEQNNGTIILKAFGKIPNEAIPMEIVITDTEISIDGNNILLVDKTTSLYYSLFIDNNKLNLEQTTFTQQSIIYTELVLKDISTGKETSIFVDNGSLYIENENTD